MTAQDNDAPSEVTQLAQLDTRLSALPVEGKVTAKTRKSALAAAAATIKKLSANVELSSGADDKETLLQAIIDAEQVPSLLKEMGIQLAWADRDGLSQPARALGCDQKTFNKLIRDIDYDPEQPEEVKTAIECVVQALVADVSSVSGNDPFTLCHFRAKTTNTNAKGAVFIASARQSSLPYLFSATAQTTQHLPPDKLSTTIPKAIVDAMSGAIDPSDTTREHLERRYQAHPIGEQELDSVDARLRQIIVPKDGQYLGLIPMSSPPLAHRITHALDQHKAESKSESKETATKWIPPRTILNGIGGANPQNVTAFASAVRRCYFFELQTIFDHHIRLALGIAYRGYCLPRIPRSLLTDYAKNLGEGGAWRDDRNTEKSREIALKSGLGEIINFINRNIHKAMNTCHEHLDLIQNHLADKSDAKSQINDDYVLTQAVLLSRMTEHAANIAANRLIEQLENARNANEQRLFALSQPLIHLIRDVTVNQILARFGSHA